MKRTFTFAIYLVVLSSHLLADGEILFGSFVSTSVLVNLHKSTIHPTVGFTGYAILVNGSIEAQYPPALNSSSAATVVPYLGVGLVNFLQIQYGLNSSLRIRSDLFLNSENFPFRSYLAEEWGPFYKEVVLSLIVEKSLATPSRAWRVGAGIGLTI